MAIILLIYMVISSNLSYSSIHPIEDFNLEYYRNAFSTAKYQESIPINDPLSQPSINHDLLKIYDENFAFIGYIREVSTDVGCDSFCKPLDFTLALDSKAFFLKLLVLEPLTKLNHAEFTSEDNQKLHNILINPPSSYQNINHPDDLIDAITGATKLEFASDVVNTAAYTCFRIHQYKAQTLQSIRSNPLEIIP